MRVGGSVRKTDAERTGSDEHAHRIKPQHLGSHISGTIKFAKEAPYPYSLCMTATKIGYARCSTDGQDLTAQKQALETLGVAPDRVYTDHGLTGTNRARPGLDQAIAAVREGDTLVVPKLDRLARSVPDARAIADQLEAKGVKLALGASVYDPTDPMGKMFFNILATFAEFEADLIRMRTREGMAIARAKGKLRGKQPKLSEKQQRELTVCTRPENTPSAIWQRCSRSQDRPSIERSSADLKAELIQLSERGPFNETAC